MSFLVKKMVLMIEMDVCANVEVMTKVEALQMTEEPRMEAFQQEVEDKVVPVGQVEVVVEGVMMEVMEAKEVEIVVVVKSAKGESEGGNQEVMVENP